MRTFDGEEFGKAVVEAVQAAIERRCLELEVKIARLEAQLEQKSFAYVGSFRQGQTYNANTFVSDRNAIWFCRQTTKERPREGNSSWEMACKGASK
jgi:hypothetical protein